MTGQEPRNDRLLDWLRVAVPWLILSAGLGILGFHAFSYS
jgi:hypothetical protein